MHNKKIVFATMFSVLLLAACVSENLRDGDSPTTSNGTAPPKRAPSPQEDLLTVKVGGLSRSLTREDLMHMPGLKKLTIAADPAYGKQKMTYEAVPFHALFEGLRIDPSDTLSFVCLDGFSAPISAIRALNSDPRKSIAYIAIELPEKPWPALKPNESAKSAGPFYMVWENPEFSHVTQGEWPYQLAAFEENPSLERQFPLTVPDPRLPANSMIRAGYKTFMSSCFACHSLNGQGTSQMGPDLNLPFNPTEYMKLPYLAKLVRNPQNLRHWPQSKMSSFSREDLSDQDLKNVIAYLQHMSKRKAPLNH